VSFFFTVDQQAMILWIVHQCHRQLYHRKNGLKCCAEFAKMAHRICNFLAQNSDVPRRMICCFGVFAGTLTHSVNYVDYCYGNLLDTCLPCSISTVDSTEVLCPLFYEIEILILCDSPSIFPSLHKM